MNRCPDKQLNVRCAFNGKQKRISFQSARNCNYDLLRHKVDQCFSLRGMSYIIAWEDDDGEITPISSNDDLIDAILYFQAGDDAPLSSATSILSGKSFGGSRKITIRVEVTMEYDGPSLSDTSSLASFDDYKGRNASQHSFSIQIPPAEPDDDSVTVSSKDIGSNSRRTTPPSRADPFEGDSNTSSPESSISVTPQTNGKKPRHAGLPKDSGESLEYASDRFAPSNGSLVSGAMDRFPEDPSAVFERLRLRDAMSDSSSINHNLGGNTRGQAWLRDQAERVIRSKLGMLPEPSEPDDASFSLQGGLDGDLALERNNRGSYYYTYTASSQHEESSYPPHDATRSETGYPPDLLHPRPSSMHLSWLASQQANVRRQPKPSVSMPALNTHYSDPLPLRESQIEDPSAIEPKPLPYLPLSEPPEHILTDCSSCGVLLDSIRYVCSTCGEKEPKQKVTASKGKGRESTGKREGYDSNGNPYIPMNVLGYSSSPTMVGSSETLSYLQQQQQRPLHTLPSLSSLPSIFGLRRAFVAPETSQASQTAQMSQSPQSPRVTGCELCPSCIETAGVDHAILAASPSNIMSSSPEDPQQALQWRKAPPKKGHLRHAYHEMLWGLRGWENVVYEESIVSKCSTCSAVTSTQRYKCAVCEKIGLCRGCYSQVHDIHPSHPFILVPDRPKLAISEPDFLMNQSFEPGDEQSMKHPGVRCFHCMMDILGARFHCAVCPDVDICSNCESAGLPGNLHSSDGGHDSSHILIKIPYPLGAAQVQNASRRAVFLWNGRDAASVGYPAEGPQPDQEMSSYARTVVGSGSSRDTLLSSPDSHGFSCNSCRLPIVGVRYQCAHCPSIPNSFNLCINCDARSHIIHDPMHIFFKLPRPVQRPIESTYPILPLLYRVPAGAQTHMIRQNDSRAYLKQLKHESAICDRCMDRIQGEWFHCVYCARDLCETCEALDTHDDSHFFVVFKSNIDMQIFKNFANLDSSDSRQAPILPYAVYHSS